MSRNNEFKVLYESAVAAGKAAVAALNVVPMVVTEGDIFGKPIPGAKRYFVADGVCGFAWVKIRPANSAFANWLKKNKLGSTAYGGGLQIWISDYNQSMQKKEAFASGMADTFRAAGISAYADSRMD